MGGQGLGRVPARAGVAMLFGTFQAILTGDGETDDHRVVLDSSPRSRLHGWIPMVVDGTSTTGEEYPCRIHPAAGLRLGFLALGPSAPKFRAFGRGTGRRLSFARVSQASVLFRRSSPLPISQCGGAQEHVGLNQHGGGGRGCAFGFGCLPTTPMLPAQSLRTGFGSAPIFGLGRPDSSGRGFCAGFSRLSGGRWSVAGVGSNQHRG